MCRTKSLSISLRQSCRDEGVNGLSMITLSRNSIGGGGHGLFEFKYFLYAVPSQPRCKVERVRSGGDQVILETIMNFPDLISIHTSKVVKINVLEGRGTTASS